MRDLCPFRQATLCLVRAMSNFSPLTIVFPIYPGVTQLDFTGPHQFFSRLPGVKPVVASIEGKPPSSPIPLLLNPYS
jgi:putative intracellular protease/amidase